MDMRWLLESMDLRGAQEAIVFGDQSVTYRELLQSFERWRNRLTDWGIQPGQIVAIEGDYSPEACSALLACIHNDQIIAPLSLISDSKRRECMEIAEIQHYLRFDGSAYELTSHECTVSHELLKSFTVNKKAALILFSSGSTGNPKAIVHDLAKLMDKYRTKRDALRTITFLLFDHIGGFNTLLHTISNGGTVVLPRSKSPHDICLSIERHRVELLPATPSFLNMLWMTGEIDKFDLSSLKIVTYGTEVMPMRTLKRVNELLPNVQFRQTYGMSELGILRAKSRDSGSLWVKLGGESVETKVIDGILHVKSSSAMVGYLNAPSPFDEEGWLNTQDRVVTDGDYIRILGRASEIINVGGQKVYPVEVEDVLLQMSEVQDVVVKAQANPLLGQVVSAVVQLKEPMDGFEVKRRLREFCAGKLERYQIPVYVQIRDDGLVSERFKKIRK